MFDKTIIKIILIKIMSLKSKLLFLSLLIILEKEKKISIFFFNTDFKLLFLKASYRNIYLDTFFIFEKHKNKKYIF